MGERQRFFGSLSFRSKVSLLLFIFFTFSPLSVLILSRFTEQRSWVSLAAFAAMSGFTAVGWAFAFMRSFHVLWILIPAQSLWWLIPWYFRSDFQTGFNLSLEGAACAGMIVLGYTLFVRFVRGEGAKSIRMETELSLARQIHESLLPPIAVHRGRLEIFGRSLASSEMGGDLMDVVDCDGAVSVYIADVSGHGVKAGVVMAMTKTAVRMKLHEAGGPSECLQAANEILCELSTPEMFVTGACLQFQRSGPGSGPMKVNFSGAGHGAIFHYRRGAGNVERLESDQLPLGIASSETYSARMVSADEGDAFLLMTDGLFETFNTRGEALGEAAIECEFRQRIGETLPRIHDSLMTLVNGHGPRADDQTLLLIRVT